MLDLDHPRTTHIFAESAQCDAVLTCAKQMTLASAQERQVLLRECAGPLKSLHKLNAAHFGASPFIVTALDGLESALQTLADAVVDDAVAGQVQTLGLCPACGMALTKIVLSRRSAADVWQSVYCNSSLNTVMPSLLQLESLEGFCTCAI